MRKGTRIYQNCCSVVDFPWKSERFWKKTYVCKEKVALLSRRLLKKLTISLPGGRLVTKTTIALPNVSLIRAMAISGPNGRLVRKITI